MMNGKVIWTSVKRIADVMNFLSEKYYQERSGIPHYQVELPPDNPDGRVAGMGDSGGELFTKSCCYF